MYICNFFRYLQNHRTVWVGGDLKVHLVPVPCHVLFIFYLPQSLSWLLSHFHFSALLHPLLASSPHLLLLGFLDLTWAFPVGLLFGMGTIVNLGYLGDSLQSSPPWQT